MRNFFKMFAASLLAFFVMSIFPFFILVGIVGILSSTEDEVVLVPDNSVLVVDLSKTIVDVISDNPLDYFDFNTLDLKSPLTITKAIQSIYNASKDDRIVSMYIDARSDNKIPTTTLQELRRAILEFKKTGKKVYSYASTYSNSSYYLSSVADEVVIAPMGNLMVLGMELTATYYKEFFTKIGIDVDLIRVGKYKSAGEPFITNKMSASNRTQLNSMVNSLWWSLLSDISKSRGISSNKINDMINELSAVEAKDAKSSNLIDDILYYDEFNDLLTANDEKFISLNKYSTVVSSFRSDDEKGKPVLYSKNKIAVINAQGAIINGKSKDGSVGDFTFCKRVKELREDDDVKAVVLRINSPGGSASASEYMWRELSLLQKKKPLIVSMGGYAASGGYYIAAPADFIFAEETTLTGSIGVFSMLYNVKGTADKLGLSVYTISSNDNTGLLGSVLINGLNKQEHILMQNSITNIYDTFKKRVSQGRNLSLERVEELAQGRIWTGSEALGNGLIDATGGILDAVYMAADKAGVSKDFVLEEPTQKNNSFATVISFFNSKIETYSTPDFGLFQKDYEFINSLRTGSEIKAAVPFLITVK